MTIELHTWGTPNGRKISIALEEMQLPYRVHPVNITAGEQFAPEFLAVSPNNRIPAIVDPDGPGGEPITLFESGAILIYLAAKSGKFYPQQPRQRMEVLQWLMWQMGGFGPMLGQAHHFRRFAGENVPYAIERYTGESARLYGVLDKQLAGRGFVAGDYSIADMAIYPWAARYEWQGVAPERYPEFQRWFTTMSAREGVIKGMAVPAAA